MTHNAMASLLTALKVHPEQHSLPESLQDASPVELAEARSRFQEIAAVANELRKLVDAELLTHLQGGAMRYGSMILKPATRGRAKIVDEEMWWQAVVKSLYNTDDPAGLLARLYPASAVRLTALPLIAAVLDVDDQALRSTFIEYDPPTAAIDVIPIAKAAKWMQALAEGQLSNQRIDGNRPPEEAVPVAPDS